jgi:hypothetical protein
MRDIQATTVTNIWLRCVFLLRSRVEKATRRVRHGERPIGGLVRQYEKITVCYLLFADREDSDCVGAADVEYIERRSGRDQDNHYYKQACKLFIILMETNSVKSRVYFDDD